MFSSRGDISHLITRKYGTVLPKAGVPPQESITYPKVFTEEQISSKAANFSAISGLIFVPLKLKEKIVGYIKIQHEDYS